MYNKKRWVLIPLILCFIFVSFTQLTAQELILSKVYMKDGNVFIGEITRYESGIITIKTEYGTFNLDDSKVKYISISGIEPKETYKEPCIVLKDGKVIPGKILSYVSVLKRVKVSSTYGDIMIDRFKDIALIVLETVKENPWLSGWAYRKKITIAGSTKAGTNYQVFLKIGESSGAIGADFNLEGLSEKFPSGENDGGDLRFTASDGVTLQDFWVESVYGASPNRVAYVWVKITDDLGSNRDIYCYFGNSSASNASNGFSTFIFFDDFNDNSLNTNKWMENNFSDGDCIEQNQRLELYGPKTYSVIQLESNSPVNVQNKEIRIRIRNQVLTRVNFYISLTKPALGNQQWDELNWYMINMEEWDGDKCRIIKRINGRYSTLYEGKALSRDEDIAIRVIGTIIKFFEQNTERCSETYVFESYNCYFIIEGRAWTGYTGTDWVDTILVRKYATPEPAFSSSGRAEKRN